MRHIWMVLVALVLVCALPASAVGSRLCTQHYTLQQFKRATKTTYSGRDLPQKGAYGHLWRLVACQKRSGDRSRAKRFWWSQQHAWAARRHFPRSGPRAAGPMSTALASWYDDSGSTASGRHDYYGVANRTVMFGTKVEFCYRGKCVIATVDDRGPYVYPRDWDLNQNTARAIGFSGVAKVRYKLLR